MQKHDPSTANDELLPEYGKDVFERGVRGKHYSRYQAGTNLVRLEPDVRAAIPTDEAVNRALRMLVNLAHQSVERDAG